MLLWQERTAFRRLPEGNYKSINQSISFGSNVWGSRVSDKQITQECRLLQLLLPGDLVLADRGFNAYELVGM